AGTQADHDGDHAAGPWNGAGADHQDAGKSAHRPHAIRGDEDAYRRRDKGRHTWWHGMIAAFEQRLADVLGARLPPPFRGHVAVAPAPAPSADPAVVVVVERADSVDPDFNSRRPEIAPGVADPRRILRMNCTVGVRVQPANNAGRRQQMDG